MERETAGSSGETVGSAGFGVLLGEGVGDLVELDPAGLDDGLLHELIVGLQAQRSRLAVAAAGLLAEWDRRRIWEGDGSRSAAHRLARETRSSMRTSRSEMCRARRIGQMAATREAVTAGRLSVDHLDLFAHVNTPARRALFDRDEALLVGECCALCFADAARVVRYWAIHADEELATDTHTAAGDADTTSDADAAAGSSVGLPPFVGSRLHASRTLDDTLVIDGVFDPIGGTIVESELLRLADQIGLTDRAAGIDRTPAQRRAAALIEMARRSATTPANGRRPRPLFTVLIGEGTLDRLCELDNGVVITPEGLLAHLAEADIESVLFDGPTTIVAVSSRRNFTGAVRRAIQVRDRRCQHPSQCDIPADQCDIDHITPYANHGPTSQFNGRLQCPTHNRNHHLHDHDANPQPERTLTRLDELRVRIRWRCRNDPTNTDDDDPHG